MYFWSKFPFVRVVIFFILGILSGVFLPGYQIGAGVGLIVSVSFLIILSYKRKNLLIKLNPVYGSVISLSFLLFGYLMLWQATDTIRSNHIINFNKGEYYAAKLISQPEIKGNFLRAKVKISAIKQQDWIKTSGKAMVYLRYNEGDTHLSYGDEIMVKGFPGLVEKSRNPYEFDYRQYLAYNNIHHQDFVNRNKWTISNRASGFSLVGISIKIRNKLEQVLARYIHQPEELAIAKALILGNKEDLDKSTKETFATAGAMHVLAVSGLHVGIIYLVLISLLGQKRSNITKPVLIAVIVIPILWLYAFITGLSPSVLRAVTMFSFLTLAHVFGRRSNTLNILAISAFILLMFNPYMIMAVGFQLSYVAVIGIIFLFPVIERRITPSNQVLRVVWQITALSVAAQLATFPLSALYFHRFPTYFLISNLVVIPAATLIIWGGLLLLLAGSISGFLGSIIGSGVGFIIGIVNTVLKSMTQWPYADIQNLVPSIFESWITYGIIILFFLFLIEKKRLYYHLSLAAIIVLVANLFYWEIKGNNLRQVTIYSIHNRWAIDLIENRKYQTITDSLLSTETSKIDFHITPYRRQFNLQIDNRSIKTRKTQWGDAFVWHGKKILLADPCINSIELPEIFDLLLIKPAVSSYDCYQEQIVLRKLVEDQQIHFEEHNLKKEGALIINL